MHYTNKYAAAAFKPRPDYVRDEVCSLAFLDLTTMYFHHVGGTTGSGILWRKCYRCPHSFVDSVWVTTLCLQSSAMLRLL